MWNHPFAANSTNRGNARPFHLFWNLGITLVLLLTLLPVAHPSVPIAPRPNVQPVLQELAQSHPDQLVSVIVQVGEDQADVANAIESLGGRVTHDLFIINSLSATLPAGHVPQLAQHAEVNWISYDAPMREASVDQDPVVYTTWASELAASYQVSKDFQAEPIQAGSTIWFNAIFKAKNLPSAATVYLRSSRISFVANGESYQIPVPNARIEFIDQLAAATTYFDRNTQSWVTQAPTTHSNKEIFLTGVPFYVTNNLPGGIKDVRWDVGVEATRTDLDLEWRWAAAVYQKQFPADYNELRVKPVKKTETPSAYMNDNLAATPTGLTTCNCLIKGATGAGGSDYVGSYTTWNSLIPSFGNGEGVSFAAASDEMNSMVEAIGPNRRYGWAGFGVQAVAGFNGVFTPGYAISKIEILLHTYVPAVISKDAKLRLHYGDWSQEFVIRKERFNQTVGQETVIAVDVTSARNNWAWWQLSDIVVTLDHSQFGWSDILFYDAIGLRVTNLTGQVETNVKFPKVSNPELIDVSNLAEVFTQVVGATQLWNEASAYLQGRDITVAVVDSGVAKSKDFGSRKFADINFNREYHDGNDKYGHGTFVAGMLAGNGKSSHGSYMGVAPSANVLNVRVSNDQGMSTEADVIAALQWIVLNREAYRIRVVNLSLNSSVAQSYRTSPLSVAVEILWFSGIVVVVSAGNSGTADLYPPANDPYVITVGATDDRGTVDKIDDVVAHFSAFGVDEAGHVKPELVAPGTNIVAYLPNNGALSMGKEHWANRVDKDHFRMSGTSMAAPVVSGIAVLLLQSEPTLTPNQVKQRLMTTANHNWPGYDPIKAGAGYVDGYAAVHTQTMENANQNIMPTLPLAQMALIAYWASQNGAETIDWGSVNWNSVNWNSVNWNSVNWNSVNWNSVNWNSVNWNSVNWNSVNWNSVNWNSVNWNSVNWNSVNWNSVNWNSVNWNSVNWNSVNWNSTYWDSTEGLDSLSASDAEEFSMDTLVLPEIHHLFLPSVQH